MSEPRALNEFIVEANEILETLGRELLALDQPSGGEVSQQRADHLAPDVIGQQQILADGRVGHLDGGRLPGHRSAFPQR